MASLFSCDPPTSDFKQKKSKPNCFDKAIHGSDGPTSYATIESETNHFLGDCDCHRGHILSFWKENEDLLPGLAKMARIYLAIPATSTSSEGVFSKTKSIIGPQRAPLNPMSVEILLCLKEWFCLFGPMFFPNKPKSSGSSGKKKTWLMMKVIDCETGFSFYPFIFSTSPFFNSLYCLLFSTLISHCCLTVIYFFLSLFLRIRNPYFCSQTAGNPWVGYFIHTSPPPPIPTGSPKYWRLKKRDRTRAPRVRGPGNPSGYWVRGSGWLQAPCRDVECAMYYIYL